MTKRRVDYVAFYEDSKLHILHPLEDIVLKEGQYKLISVDEDKGEMKLLKQGKGSGGFVLIKPYGENDKVHHHGEENDEIIRILKTIFLLSLLTFNLSLIIFLLILWQAYVFVDELGR